MLVTHVQQLGAKVPSSLGRREVSWVAALLGVVEAAIHVGGVTKDMLKREEGEGMRAGVPNEHVVLSSPAGELPAPAVSWSHANGVFPLLVHTLSVWVQAGVGGEDQVRGGAGSWVQAGVGGEDQVRGGAGSWVQVGVGGKDQVRGGAGVLSVS